MYGLWCKVHVSNEHNMAAKRKPDQKHFELFLQEEICCPICTEIFETPKCLPVCAHNVCLSCLKKMKIEQGFIKCPICRKKTKITNPAECLPTNSLLVRLVENAPGRKEELELRNELKTAKRVLDAKLKKVLSIFSTYQSLSREILNHAETMQKNIKEQADSLILQVQEKTGFTSVISPACVAREKEYLAFRSKIAQIEDTLKNGNLTEIAELSSAYIAELKAIQDLPALEVPAFNRGVRFKKGPDVNIGRLKMTHKWGK
ncbi:tripartite motif containing 13 isoform X1 [Nematostella vectensis]|uniref:tripartite motif containing 13 isoform X1 n=2 Tax=Nematostella vectensis TaxID=45351 RepID=UPI0020774399|nr:tripartite motif containing 13 isoform X1 [Nematostella vectensis]